MMQATLDIGSNTVRMLIGSCSAGRLHPSLYERRITRLGGGFSPAEGLSPEAVARTVKALNDFSLILKNNQAQCLRAVGTAALRRAANRQQFIDHVYKKTGIRIEVIDGEEEARLTALGVLSVITPQPENAVIFDIGGGSTEILWIVDGRIRVQKSYPLGVVRLAEEHSDHHQRQQLIDATLIDFHHILQQRSLPSQSLEVIGTAGTMTTLAAMDLSLTHYDPATINNHQLSLAWMQSIYHQLEPLSATDREQLKGMEQGRGDLILPGLQLASTIAQSFRVNHLKVADAGLLEGTFLDAGLD